MRRWDRNKEASGMILRSVRELKMGANVLKINNVSREICVIIYLSSS